MAMSNRNMTFKTKDFNFLPTLAEIEQCWMNLKQSIFHQMHLGTVGYFRSMI